MINKEWFLSKILIDINTKCWNWQGFCFKRAPGVLSYGQFNLNGKTLKAHRVSYEIFSGKIKNGLKCLHKCDNPSCVNPAHLFLGTDADNVRDKIAKGRQCKGETHGMSILSLKDIYFIRASTDSQTKLGKQFNVSQQHISRIKLGICWVNNHA